jgi:hypothetical protein
MNINIPISVWEHFWQEPPPSSMEFWSFRFMPRSAIGDEILFHFDKKLVAKAIVATIEKPGQSACEATGRFQNGWKVLWDPATFVDLREKR